MAALDDKAEAYSPRFAIYTEPVDMTCKIVDLRQGETRHRSVFHWETDEFLQFDVCLRNNGTQASVIVQTVSVVLIKEPEGFVVAQEEWGFGSSIYPRLWYMASEPVRFNIGNLTRSLFGGKDESVNLEAGAYRVEVTVDPNNLLGEDPTLRQDNKTIFIFDIR